MVDQVFYENIIHYEYEQTLSRILFLNHELLDQLHEFDYYPQLCLYRNNKHESKNQDHSKLLLKKFVIFEVPIKNIETNSLIGFNMLNFVSIATHLFENTITIK